MNSRSQEVEPQPNSTNALREITNSPEKTRGCRERESRHFLAHNNYRNAPNIINAAASGGGTLSIAPASFGLTHKIAAVHPKLISNYLAFETSRFFFFYFCKNESHMSGMRTETACKTEF